MASVKQPVGVPSSQPGQLQRVGHRLYSHSAPKLDFFVAVALGLISVRPLLDIFRDTIIGSTSVTSLAGIAIIGFGILGVVGARMPAPRHHVTKLLILYTGWSVLVGLVVLFWSEANAFVPTTLRLLLVLLGYLLFFELGAKRPAAVPRLLALAAAPACLLALVQLSRNVGRAGSDFVREAAGLSRVFGPFDHPNALAIYCGLILMLAVGIVLASRGEAARLLGWIALAVLCFVVVVPTYARIVWLSIPVALIAMGIVTRRRLIPLATVGLGIVFAVTLAREQVATRLSGFSSLGYRQRLWQGILDQVGAFDLLLGIGAGHVNALVVETTERLGTSAVIQVHNDYLRVLIESGIVGIASYFGAILAAFIAAWRGVRTSNDDLMTRRLCCATVGASVMVLLVSVSDNIVGLPVLQLVYWGLVGGTMGRLSNRALGAHGDAQPLALSLLKRGRGPSPMRPDSQESSLKETGAPTTRLDQPSNVGET